METKSIQITPPKGYEVDKEHSTFEKIVFKPIDSKPRSWEEYCEQQNINDKKGYQINDASCDISEVCWRMYSRIDYWRNVLPSKELAEAFLAMMQLMSLRQAWIGNWEPNWSNHKQLKANILCNNREFIVAYFNDLISRPLSFPTKEMAKEFLNCFKDLLEIAKPLI